MTPRAAAPAGAPGARFTFDGALAQSVEHRTFNPLVDGSIPSRPSLNADLRDLTIPPSNQLEPLKGDRQGQHSIRINKQWRVCFKWRERDAFDVEIVDYH